MNAYQRFSELPGKIQHNDGFNVQCPCHDDDKASLSVRMDGDRLLLHCHAGCAPKDILDAMGLTWKDCMGDDKMTERKMTERKIVKTYDYKDEKGKLLYQVVRYEPKDFRQRRPVGDGWEWSLGNVHRVLYRLSELLEADPTRWVFIVEGEKDVDRLHGIGVIATTNAGGAGKWRESYSQSLLGRNLIIIPDSDEPGREHARHVERVLRSTVERVRVIELSDHKDISDWLDAGHGNIDLVKLVKGAPYLRMTKTERRLLLLEKRITELEILVTEANRVKP